MTTNLEFVIFIGMRVTSTWGCLLSLTVLSYNLFIASNRKRFERLNQNRFVYSVIVWFVSLTVASIIDCLFVFNAKPNCLASFFEFIVCNIAIIFCIITIYYWQKYYQSKMNIILFNVLEYLVVIIVCFFPLFVAKLLYYIDYFENNFIENNVQPKYYHFNRCSVVIRALYDVFIAILVLQKQYSKCNGLNYNCKEKDAQLENGDMVENTRQKQLLYDDYHSGKEKIATRNKDLTDPDCTKWSMEMNIDQVDQRSQDNNCIDNSFTSVQTCTTKTICISTSKINKGDAVLV